MHNLARLSSVSARLPGTVLATDARGRVSAHVAAGVAVATTQTVRNHPGAKALTTNDTSVRSHRTGRFAISAIRAWLSLLLLAAMATSPDVFAGGVTTDIMPLPERLAGLRTGGHLLVMRHAATDHTQKDRDRSLTPDCRQQRDLSALGIRQARTIGSALKRLGIPVGAVYSSPYCRATNTAALVFGDYEVDDKLQFSISQSRNDANALANHLYTRLIEAEPGDSNIAIVTHTSNIRDATGIWPKPEGAVLVFEPNGSTLRYKGTIRPDEWPQSDMQ